MTAGSESRCPVQPQVAKSRTSLRVILRSADLPCTALSGKVGLNKTVADNELESLLDGEVIEVADPGQGPVAPGGVIGGEGDGAPASRRGEGSFKGSTGENADCKAVPGMREQRRALMGCENR